MTSNFPVGETTWMVDPLLSITERSEDVGESRKNAEDAEFSFFHVKFEAPVEPPVEVPIG